ncbi:carbohydrate porin [Nostoc flagelliforme FACHB-838]|uniref:Carbohydrate porin n=1 Tax=Nostoc flagelliforme FACHB-838 TaxID=2692904 RepID=A0ABR8DUP3_9NOSO|nr:iron uptake porin [Nostoc flagelliforme]MBD2533065.1 carbohydrate porin [Nostoc flagelliforme FACHB-838]
MRNSYLSLAQGVSILCLTLQSASVLAETLQPPASSEPVVNPTILEVRASVIEALEPTSEILSLMTQTATEAVPEDEIVHRLSSEAQVTSVSQLADVQPADWAFQALQSLIERYGVIAGYPDGSYRGNSTMTRYEFAAGIKAALERVQELIASGVETQVTREDLLTLQQLQKDFAIELASLQGRVDNLEANTAKLEANQFSTTTKLTGLVVAAVTGGGFSGDRIIDPKGAEIANQNPNATFVYRASLNLNTSFGGTDSLLVRLEAGSALGNDNAAGFLEPTFGSVLDFSYRSAINDEVLLTRLYYSFMPFKDLKVTLGPTITAPDFVDRNSYANQGHLDFSTLALTNNYILSPLLNLGAGGVIEWNPGAGAFTMRAVYVAGDAANPNPNSQSSRTSVSPLVNLLFSDGDGESGLFKDPYQGTVELEYAPSSAFALRLQYSGGNLFDGRFDVFGVNIELALSQQLAIFGRYGYGRYNNTDFGDIQPNYWMAGLALRDPFVPGALAGIAAAQPFIENAVGNATQTNIEAFYNLPLSDNIRITPVVQVITNPANQESNGTIITGTVRTSISF